MNGETVLVTGATGFVGLHTVLQLLEQGYVVRGTLRSPGREAEIRETVVRHIGDDSRLSLFVCDLLSDDGWDAAADGCTYIHHVASPFILGRPQHEDDLIVPARDGTLRVLRAGAKAGVKRTVLTSSVAAVSAGHKDDPQRVFNEDDWSLIESPSIGAYEKSKTLAERSAWDFIKTDGGDMDLVVINPGAILGPILNTDYGTSGELVRQLMNRSMPACPQIGFSFVDVRDVASAHMAAMTSPHAGGRRFIAAIDFSWVKDVASVLDLHFREKGYKIPVKELPNWVPRLMQHFNPQLKSIVPNLGRRREYDNYRIKTVLGWKPRSLETMTIAMGESMIKYGVA